MGKRGPAPTPTPILKLRGSARATKKRQAGEIPGPAGLPDPPAWLDADARAAWDELVPMLDGMGVLTRIDGHALSRYCHLWSRWLSAERFIRDRGVGYPVYDESGKATSYKPWPQVQMATALAAVLTRLEHEFGMTPSARSRISKPAAEGIPAKSADKSRFFCAHPNPAS